MTVIDQIKQYIESQPESKALELQTLHELILAIDPSSTLWFDNGINPEGKVVSNTSIGYGKFTIHYANGSTKDFFRVGLSGNKSGISIYIMGLPDKNYLTQTFGERIGKAKVTGYCIKFKALKDISIDVLEEAVRYGLASDSTEEIG